jgi:hypothetical protein
MLLSVDAGLTPDQVTTILERTATDASGGNGCRPCLLGRDAYTGWGRLDVAAAVAELAGTPPPPDGFEPNDDAGPAAWPLSGRSGTLHATLDFWDDQSDVYRVLIRKGEKLFAVLSGPSGTDTVLALWKPETVRVDDLRAQDMRVRQSARPGFVERLSFRAPRTAYYYLQVKVQEPAGGAGPYTLQFSKKG